MIGFLLSLLLVLAVLVGVKSSANAQEQDPEMPPVDQIIVKYKQDANLQHAAQAQAGSQMQRLNAAAGVTIDYFRPMSGDAHVLRLEGPLPVDQARAITARLESLPEVEYAEPDYIAYPLEGDLFPNDPRYYEQWHYFAPTAGNYGVNAPAAWDITKGASSLYIAVLDTGITDHADLAGRWIGGYDLISDPKYANDGDGRDADPRDPGDWSTASDSCGARESTWHGTHVAGTIGAASNNSKGVAGLNWVSKIVPVRVLGRCGNTISDIADGIRWAAGLTIPGVPVNLNPAKVINLSLGGYTPTGCASTYQNAINAAYGAGSVIVVSAGNENIDAKYYQPGNCANVITVAATSRDGSKAIYSNWGGLVEISAPGGDSAGGVLSTSNTGTTAPDDDTYLFMGGTSMAAPHVSGVVSLMFSLNPALTPSQVQSILQSTATTISCSLCGSGIVNAATALQAVPDAAPGVPVLSAINNPFGEDTYTVNWNDVPNADSYRLQQADNPSFSEPDNRYQGTDTSYLVTGQPAGTWYYRVQSINSDGISAWSSTVSTTVKPDPPVLDAISNPTNDDNFTISWSDVPTADGYLLLEADNPSFSEPTTKYMGSDTTYEVTGQAGGTWYYHVRAYNDGINGDWSNIEVTSVTPSPLEEPTLEPIDNPDQDGDFTVSWSTVTTATYILEESSNPYFVDPVVVYDGPLTEKQIEHQKGGSWYYRVRAVSNTDQSPWSNSESTLVLNKIFLPLVFNQYASTSDCTPDPAGDSDDIGDALVICDGQVVAGQVSDDDWDDVFQIYAVKGQTLSAALVGSGGDADLYLYAPGSAGIYLDSPVAASLTRGSNVELISLKIPQSGYWYVNVYSYFGTINYSLTTTLVTASSNLKDAPLENLDRDQRTRP
jgi:subtilisin family serine protease